MTCIKKCYKFIYNSLIVNIYFWYLDIPVYKFPSFFLFLAHFSLIPRMLSGLVTRGI